jgi:hypothetical protein
LCVIMVGQTVRPTDEMIERGYDANNSGAGIAWQEVTASGEVVVRWEKGLDLEEIKEYVRTAPLPFVAHFRIPSCGGASPELCHPFPITDGVELAQNGSTPGAVLFHNGHWGAWKDCVMREARERRAHLPAGRWTDTRAMAWMAYLYGTPILDLIDEKTVVMSPTNIEIFGNGWTKVNDVWCSNTGWNTSRSHHGWQGATGAGYYAGSHHTMCRERTCVKIRSADSEWCGEHSSLDPKNAKKVDAGGSTAEQTFPSGSTTSQAGAAGHQEAQEGTAGVGGGAAGAAKEEGKVNGSPQKLLGPATKDPQQLAIKDMALQTHEVGLATSGDTAEDWLSMRRWVRSLQEPKSSTKTTGSSTDLADEVTGRKKRREARQAGFINMGPL